MACTRAFVPCWLLELAPVATPLIIVIGAIVIPIVTFRAARAQQRRQAALDLARTLYTSGEITSRMEKLYRKRRYDEAIKEARGPEFVDPYSGSMEALIFDLVLVLNYMETICVEVKLRNASEETLLQAVGVTLVGARDVLLTRLDELLEADQIAAYSALVEVSEKFRPRIEKEGGQTQIPDPKFESAQ